MSSLKRIFLSTVYPDMLLKKLTAKCILITISSNTTVYEEPEPRTKKIPHHSVNFEAGKHNTIVYESFTATSYLDRS